MTIFVFQVLVSILYLSGATNCNTTPALKESKKTEMVTQLD